MKLEKVKLSIPENALLFTMDVKSLYPSIPRTESLEACYEALENRTNKDIPTEAVLTLIKTVLENNVFQFNNQNFIQVDGTAIGSKLGKNLASTYMGVWEKELLQTSKIEPFMYVRLVDDIFGIWNGTEQELKDFEDTANNIHPRIKVEMTMSKSLIQFLDVNISKHQGTLETTIFHKPTDRHLYLHST